MPHAAVIAASVTVGAAALVGAAVAYEMYRESQGEVPIMDTVRAGWDEFRDDLRRGLWDFREQFDANDGRPPPPMSDARRRRDGRRTSSSDSLSDQSARPKKQEQPPRESGQEDEQEMHAVRRELEEFEMQERETANATGRTLWENTFGQNVRQRRTLQGATWQDDHSDSRLIDFATPLIHQNEPSTAQSDPSKRSYTVSSRTSHDLPLPPLASVEASTSVSTPLPHADHSDAQSTVISDEEWFSRASSPSTQFVNVHHQEDGNLSDAWTQLDDSVPGTPTSGSWSAMEHDSRHGHA